LKKSLDGSQPIQEEENTGNITIENQNHNQEKEENSEFGDKELPDFKFK